MKTCRKNLDAMMALVNCFQNLGTFRSSVAGWLTATCVVVLPQFALGQYHPANGMLNLEPVAEQQANRYYTNSAPINGAQCGLTACNPPSQPQTAIGRCQPCYQAVDCADNCGGQQGWKDLHPYDFGPLAHGEYLGPIRLPATMNYRLRVGDRIQFTFIPAREKLTDNMRLQVGDELEITSVTDADVRLGDLVQGKGAKIQADGMLYLRQIEPVPAHGLTIPQLRRNLEVAYSKLIRSPAINVIPIRTNTMREDLLSAVDARAGQGGRVFADSVHPDGTVRLPKLGSICVQGMTLDELKREVNLRYGHVVTGLEVEPSIEQEALHFIFVFGEVVNPNRFQLLGPTTVTQALSLAGGHIQSRANNRQIVIFRRGYDYRLIATKLDLRGAHLGKVPTPADEIFLRDGDLIIVPPTPFARANDAIDVLFTRGIYAIFPFAQLGEGFNAQAFGN